ncbi:MAG: hypothetical protein HUJ83_10450 [Veillonella sp.]|nr:hypothetical protein [Veillonella sp.]
MLREIQVTKDKPANAMYSAAVEVKTGMAVVKNETAKTFGPATAATAADVFFVDKERVPSGINAARTDMSDYDEDFVTVKANEKAKLIAYYVGERFATDQVTGLEALVVGNRLAAGTDGKLAKAGSGVASKYVFAGIYKDANAHDLALVEVSDTPKAN